MHGTVVRDFSFAAHSSQDEWYTFLVDIGEQEPLMGADPEFPQTAQILADVRWMSLAETPERDRAFLWTSGLLLIEDFHAEVSSWGDRISYPGSDGATTR